MAREFDAATELHLKKALELLHREFDGVHPPERIEALMTDSLEQIATQSRVESYLPALAARLTRERLLADDAVDSGQPQVLFVGLHDTGRGQLAAALMRAYAGSRIGVHSAGSGRLEEIEDAVRVVLAEVGVELDDAYSKPLTSEVLEAADVVVTMGRSVGEVELPARARHLDWRVGDPGGAPIDEVRRIRDDIAERVRRLADELAPSPD
jgi:arsenate reductase